MLPPVMLPVALTTPVTYSPVVANTTTLLTPVIPTVTLALAATVTFELPLVIAAPALATIPVSWLPLPKI